MSRAALITGASKGIGLETAKALAEPGSGYDIFVLVARQSSHFDSAKAEMARVAPGKKVLAIEADLDDPTSVERIYDALDEAGIRLNLIVNNAGFTKPASINETTLPDFERTMRINVYAPFLIIQAALHRQHPLTNVVNIASTAGINGRSGWLSYSASKAAVINMSEVLREELRPYGVDVISLSPGRCATDLRRTLAPDEDPSTIMQPQQVAEVVRLMVSGTGKLLLSQNLVVRT